MSASVSWWETVQNNEEGPKSEDGPRQGPYRQSLELPGPERPPLQRTARSSYGQLVADNEILNLHRGVSGFTSLWDRPVVSPT